VNFTFETKMSAAQVDCKGPVWTQVPAQQLNKQTCYIDQSLMEILQGLLWSANTALNIPHHIACCSPAVRNKINNK
jgi:hypothetical protein